MPPGDSPAGVWRTRFVRRFLGNWCIPSQRDAAGADAQVHELLTGGDVSQVEVLTSVQKADMAFRLLVQVRNKLMAAYDEINAIRI